MKRYTSFYFFRSPDSILSLPALIYVFKDILIEIPAGFLKIKIDKPIILQSPSKCSPCDTIHPLRFFSHCSQQFWSSSILVPFSASAVLFVCLFHFFHRGETFPFEDFFHPGKQKKVTRGEIGWLGRVGLGSHTVFGQKLLNTQCCGAGVRVNHLSWNGKMCWKSLQKNFTEAEHSLSQQRQPVHWYRWVPRTLT